MEVDMTASERKKQHARIRQAKRRKSLAHQMASLQESDPVGFIRETPKSRQQIFDFRRKLMELSLQECRKCEEAFPDLNVVRGVCGKCIKNPEKYTAANFMNPGKK
jgi:hypothetical protein